MRFGMLACSFSNALRKVATHGSALIDQTSEQFLGQWKRLVSTTNWEKGRIIHALARGPAWPPTRPAASIRTKPGAAASATSRRSTSAGCGGCTNDSAARQRDYPGLYWSHFQAALDWDDAEMWLEGAVQSDWSISEMRHQRWEAMGAGRGRSAGR